MLAFSAANRSSVRPMRPSFASNGFILSAVLSSAPQSRRDDEIRKIHLCPRGLMTHRRLFKIGQADGKSCGSFSVVHSVPPFHFADCWQPNSDTQSTSPQPYDFGGVFPFGCFGDTAPNRGLFWAVGINLGPAEFAAGNAAEVARLSASLRRRYGTLPAALAAQKARNAPCLRGTIPGIQGAHKDGGFMGKQPPDRQNEQLGLL